MPKRKRSKTTKNGKKSVKSSAAPGEPTSDLINNLNGDCLLRIFSYLSIEDRLRVEIVCKRWKQVCEMAWQDQKILDLSDSIEKTPDLSKLPQKFRTYRGVSKILKKFGRYIQEIKLGYPCDYDILPIISQYCTNLTKLEIDIGGYDKSCAKFFSRMPKLKYFKICGIVCYPREVFQTLPSDSLTEIHLFTSGTSHRFFDLGTVPLIAPTAIENFTKLTAISLNGFDLKPNLMNIISRKSDLKYLSLEKSVCRAGFPSLLSLSNLEHLNLTSNRDVDDNVLLEISECCKTLKSLNLRDCRKITDEGIKIISKLLKLEDLILTQIRCITGTFFFMLQGLKRFKCSWCDGVRDDEVIEFMRSAKDLEYLNVAFSGVTERVLVAANEIMRQRDSRLCVSISQTVKRAWVQGDVSPLLVVRDDEESSYLSYLLH